MGYKIADRDLPKLREMAFLGYKRADMARELRKIYNRRITDADIARAFERIRKSQSMMMKDKEPILNV